MNHTFDTRAIDEVTDQVSAFVRDGVSFTALHVTNELRKAQKWAGTFSHTRQIAPCVRDLFNGDDTSFRDPNGNQYQQSTSAQGFFVYHPYNESVAGVDFRANVLARTPLSRFDDDGASASRSPAQASTPVPVATQTPVTPTPPTTVPDVPTTPPEGRVYYNGGRDAEDGDVVTVSVSTRGDVQVPRSMTRALGLKNGDNVSTTSNPKDGTVVLSGTLNGEVLANLQPSGGALRVRVSKLFPYGVGYSPSVKVALNLSEKTITISDL